MSSIVLVLLLVVGIYLLIKVVGFALKMTVLLAVLAVAYWLLAPVLGLPLP